MSVFPITGYTPKSLGANLFAAPMKPLSRTTDTPLGPGRRQLLAGLGALLAGCAAPAVHARSELAWDQGSGPLGQPGQEAAYHVWERIR